jgi:hypothetical protein
MAAKVERRHRDAELALKRASAALEYALRHPTVDRKGRLCFQARPARTGSRAAARGEHDPISRIGLYGCPRATGDLWGLQDLVKVAVLMQKAARDMCR